MNKPVESRRISKKQLILPFLAAFAGMFVVFCLSQFSKYELVVLFLDWLKRQDLFVQEYFSLQRLLADSLMNTLPLVLFFWAFVSWSTTKPGELSTINESSYRLKFIKSFMINPLCSIFCLIAGMLLGASWLIHEENNMPSLTGIVVFYAIIFMAFGLSIKCTKYFNPTKDNPFGAWIYNHRRKIAMLWLCLGFVVYLYNIFELLISAIYFYLLK
ncbi:MAG: hypothetical protein ACSHWP_01535 [Pseudoalteromonas sp.]|jgi:hypothetical protein